MSADRVDAMGLRIRTTMARAGFAEDEVALVALAYAVASEPRRRLVADDHHPDMLHHGRTVVILLDDAQERSAVGLAAAALTETANASLRVPVEEVRRAVSADVAGVVERVPTPERARERILEELVTCEAHVRRIALAERLDYVRHLHMGAAGDWRVEHALACDVYGPVAERTDALLAHRYRAWCASFQRRFLAEPGPPPA